MTIRHSVVPLQFKVSFQMQPILSNLVDKTIRNEPHDLLSRLYREIGISAVAAALEVSGDALERRPTPKEKRDAVARQAA